MIRILVVEDSPTVRAMLVQLLEADPQFEVVGQAVNGQQAVELARHLLPDLITMDVVMPDMDGLEATRRIMAQQPTPILIVTAHADSPELNVAFDALEAGALDVVSKPNPSDGQADGWGAELLTKVRSLAGIKTKKTR